MTSHVTDRDRAVEAIVETIEGADASLAWWDGSFTGHRMSLVDEVLEELDAYGLLHHHDMQYGPRFCRVDRDCGETDPVRTVYRCYDDAERLLYIGCTVKPALRFKQHAASKAWWAEVARIEQTPVTGWRHAEEVERTAIEAERPLYNVIGNRRRLRVAS